MFDHPLFIEVSLSIFSVTYVDLCECMYFSCFELISPFNIMMALKKIFTHTLNFSSSYFF